MELYTSTYPEQTCSCLMGIILSLCCSLLLLFMVSWVEAFTCKSHRSHVWGHPAKAVPIFGDRTGPRERAGVHGAGGSGSLQGPDCSTVLFTSHSPPGLSLECICPILVLSSVGKCFLPALL